MEKIKERGLRKMRFSPADAATSMNLVCGLLSMVMAAHDQTYNAIWLIVMAMLFDSIDGNLAKMFNTVSEFGRELDSLADMVSFGTAPAFLFAEMFIQPEFAFIAFLAPAAYTVCAAVRLARFNSKKSIPGYFQGLPSPAAALGVVMFALTAVQLGWTVQPVFSNVALMFMGIIALLMVSSVLYPKPFGAEYEVWKPFFALEGTAFLLTWATLGREIGLLVFMLFYILGAPFYGLTLQKKTESALN